MDLEKANIARDARLRNRILRLLNDSRPFVIHGNQIVDATDGFNGDDIEDDAHALRLLGDLANLGMIATADRRTHRSQELVPGLLDCTVTAKGSRFVMGGEPAEVMIKDGRIVRKVGSG